MGRLFQEKNGIKIFWGIFQYFALFAGIFLFFFWLTNFPRFADPDSFYHVKIAEFLSQGEIFKVFPYLPFTALSGAFSDQHFLYHLFLLPFFAVFKNHLFAAKIAANFFASAVFVLFYGLLGKLNIKGRLFYIFVLLSSCTFIFRMNSPKAGVVSVILMIVLFWLILRKRYILMFVCSFFWVWTHGSWPLAILMASSFVLAAFSFNERTVPFWKRVFKKENVKLIAAVCGGAIFGLILNPFFPKNILFNWIQTFKIGVLGYGFKIGVGSEWYPPGIWEIISQTGLLLTLLLFAFLIFILATFIKKRDLILKKEDFIPLFFCGIFSAALFFLALKSRRNMEYFVPMAVLFSAMLINFSIAALDKEIIKNYLKKIYWKIFLAAGFVVFVFCAVFIFCHNTGMAHSNFQKGFSWDKFKNASEYVKNNSESGEIVFHSDWDDFPMLFYWNDKNYYISGLDPTFFYLNSRDLYEKYVKITSGEQATDLAKIIKNDFRSRYVLIGKDHPKMANNFSKDKNFEAVCEDDDAWVFKLKNQ
jgi:hypothetical protein